MTWLTDRIRRQSSQEVVGSDAKLSTRWLVPTGLPIRSSTPSLSVSGPMSIDECQHVCHELEGIKRAAQTRQPWTLDELVRTASGVVSFLGTTGKLVQTVLQHATGDDLVINAENVAILRGKIAEVLLYRTQHSPKVA